MRLTEPTRVAPLPAFSLPALRLPRIRQRVSPLVLIGAAVAAGSLLPLLYLLLRALEGGADGLAYLARPRTLEILANSALLSAAVCAGSIALGLPFAWLTSRAALPGRRLWLVLGLLPMVIPSYLGAMTLVAAFGPVGTLQQMLEPLGVGRLPEIYGFFGAWLAITLCTYPFIALPVRAALLQLDPALEEAARGFGLSRWRVFWRITLPALRPALLAGGLLTALYTLSDFGAVMIMRFNAFTRAIFMSYNGSFDRSRAALLALMLIVITLALVLAEWRLSRRYRLVRASVATQRRTAPVALGRWLAPSLLFLGALVGLGVVLPVVTLAGWALNPNITSAVQLSLLDLSWNAAGMSAVTALVVALGALPIALLALRGRGRAARWVVGAAYMGNAVPGLVVGLALVFFAANALPALYQTLPILIAACAIRFLPFGVASTRTALGQIEPALEEAARGLGLSPMRVLLRVTAPLARAGIFAGMALVFLNVMKELPTVLLLAPIGFRTLATRIWSASESGTIALVGLPGLALVLVSALSLALLLWRDHHTAAHRS